MCYILCTYPLLNKVNWFNILGKVVISIINDY